jgi:hypothetical protein
MFENPFSKNLRGYQRRTESKFILDNNTIQVDDSKNIFFNKIRLDKRMDDYEYEAKYKKFVKEMKLQVGNMVEFEPELRKKKKIISENKFLNKNGLNRVIHRNAMKNTYSSHSDLSRDNNMNLNLNKFISLQNVVLNNQNSIQIENSLFPSLFNNKNQRNYHKENLITNNNNLRSISKDEKKLKTIKSYKETDDSQKIKLQHKRETDIKIICNLKSFRELVMKSNVSLNGDIINNIGNQNRISTGFSARNFLNNKYSYMNKSKRKSSDFFITNNRNNNNQLNQDKFSQTQTNFKVSDNTNKNTLIFSSTQNSNFLKIEQKDFDSGKKLKIRPESNKTHYELGIKNDHFKHDFSLSHKNKTHFYSKKDNHKIQIDKDIYHTQHQNLSNKNILTQNINIKDLSDKNTNKHFNFNDYTISKGTKVNTYFKMKKTASDNIKGYNANQTKTTLNKNYQTTDNIQNKVNLLEDTFYKENLSLKKLHIENISPKAIKKKESNQLCNYNKFKELRTLRNINNDLNLDCSKLNSSILLPSNPKRNFSAKEIYKKLSDRKGQFHKEIRAISFHNTSIKRDTNLKWNDPTKKVKRKFLIREANDERIEDKQNVVLPKEDKREKDFIKSPDDNTADKKIYFIEKNKANMINHINTISRMTDENYIKYGNFLEHKYDFYAHQVDIPEYIFASARYRSKTNNLQIDRTTFDIKVVFENILKVKSRILNVNSKKMKN